MEKVVSKAAGVPPGYSLEKAREMQSSHRAVVAGSADRSLTPKSNTHGGMGRKHVPGKSHQMDLSYWTVHKLQHKIYVKLHVSNRTEALNKWSGGIRT